MAVFRKNIAASEAENAAKDLGPEDAYRMALRDGRGKDNFEIENGYSWDFCMIFPKWPANDLTFTRDAPGTIVRFLNEAGLETHCYEGKVGPEKSDELVIVKIRAPRGRVAVQADLVDLKMIMSEDAVKQRCLAGFDHPVSGQTVSRLRINDVPKICSYRPYQVRVLLPALFGRRRSHAPPPPSTCGPSTTPSRGSRRCT